MLLAGCARARAAPRVRRRGARFVPQRARVPAQGSVRSAPLCAARTLNVVGQSPCHSGTSTQEQPVSRGRRKGGLKSAPKFQGPVRRLCQLAAPGMKRLISLTVHGSLGACVGSCSLFLPRARVHSQVRHVPSGRVEQGGRERQDRAQGSVRATIRPSAQPPFGPPVPATPAPASASSSASPPFRHLPRRWAACPRAVSAHAPRTGAARGCNTRG